MQSPAQNYCGLRDSVTLEILVMNIGQWKYDRGVWENPWFGFARDGGKQ